jgi:hypothetical protein
MSDGKGVMTWALANVGRDGGRTTRAQACQASAAVSPPKHPWDWMPGYTRHRRISPQVRVNCAVRFALYVGATLIASELSYRFFESRFLRLKDVLSSPPSPRPDDAARASEGSSAGTRPLSILDAG